MKIKELAVKKNLTLADIAKALGKSKQAVYEMVEKEDVNTGIIKALCDIYEVPITYFFGLDAVNVADIQEKLTSLETENKALRKELDNLRRGKTSSAKIMVELDVTPDEFIKMGLKDKVIQIMNK